jgi:FMN-dependent NADH-azoreductase
MKLLHINSSVLGNASVSRQLTDAIVDKLKKTNSQLEIIYRDLAAFPPPHMTLASLPGDHPRSALAGPLDSKTQRTRDESQRILHEFMRADIVVVGVPMYNFGVPTQLKAWIDIIVVPGKTFEYGAHGPHGLCGNKRFIVAIARGDSYDLDAPASAEHAQSYIQTVLSFIGVTNAQFVVAERVAGGEENKIKALASALEAVRRRVA